MTHEQERAERKRIAKVMHRLIEEDADAYRDDSTGLAEDAAHEMGHDEWLDDSNHIVWEVANEVADEYDLLT